MKKARLILSASMFALAGLTAISFTSCTKDDKDCTVGMEGKNCDKEVRTKYYNTYRGDGQDNLGDTYTNWAIEFSAHGTDATEMNFRLLSDEDLTVVTTTVKLKTNTTFELVEKTNNSGEVYSGSGTVNENSASLTLKEKYSGETVTYTFSNMSK